MYLHNLCYLFFHDIGEQFPVPFHGLGIGWMQPESQVTSIRILGNLVAEGIGSVRGQETKHLLTLSTLAYPPVPHCVSLWPAHSH